MKLFPLTLSLLSLLPTLLSASPALHSTLPRTVYQFPSPSTWIENIFATSTGSLLVSLITPGELHLINPHTQTATLVHAFPPSVGNALFGIAEPSPNIFAVVVGNYSYETGPAIGSFGVWSVDLRSTVQKKKGSGKGAVEVKKIASLSGATLPNGMDALNSHTLLIADSIAANVIAVDTRTGKSRVAIQDESMAFDPASELPFGINGLKVNNGYVYYTNTYAGSISRIPVNPQTGAATGKAVTLVSGEALSTPDDFAVSNDGTVFVSRPFSNLISRVAGKYWGKGSGSAVVETVVGGVGSTVVAGVTSVTLGRTWRDRGVGYAGTSGANRSPVNGTFTEAGKIVAFALDGVA